MRWPTGASPGDVPTYDDFEGHGQLVALNHDNPSVRRLRDRGDVPLAGGRRGRLAARCGVRGAIAVLGRGVPRVRERFPEAYLVGEVIHGDYPSFVVEGGWTRSPSTSCGRRSAARSRKQLLRAGACAGATCRVPRDLRPAHLRRKSRRDPDRQRGAGRASAACAGAALLRRRDTHDLLRRRARLAGVKEERFGGDDAIRPAFARPDELGFDADGVGARRVPRADRRAPSPGLAASGDHDGAESGQRVRRLRQRATTRTGSRSR